MIKQIFIIAFLLMCEFVYAQKIVKKTSDLTDQLREEYSVLKADKKIRQGEYAAFYKKQFISGEKFAARGNYQDGKRVGLWDFFSLNGKLVQTYDYDQNKLVLADTTDTRLVKYYVPAAVNSTDTISSLPYKVGGYSYGILLLWNNANVQIIKDMQKLGISSVIMTHIFSVSDNGDLVKHEVLVKGKVGSRKYVIDDSKFDDEYKQFVPAAINHLPVASQVFVTGRLAVSTFVTTKIFLSPMTNDSDF